MLIVAGVKCTTAIFKYEKLAREALTLQVVCMLAEMGTMLMPKKGEYVLAVCYCRMLLGTHVTAVYECRT